MMMLMAFNSIVWIDELTGFIINENVNLIYDRIKLSIGSTNVKKLYFMQYAQL
jgi:hypothetical protein